MMKRAIFTVKTEMMRTTIMRGKIIVDGFVLKVPDILLTGSKS